MFIYLLYFLIGGTVVTAAVYIGHRAGGVTAALIAAIPIIDTINVILLYRNAGADASVAYAKTILCFVPLLASLLVVAIFLLPHLQRPELLLPSLALYGLPVVATQLVRHHRRSQGPEEVDPRRRERRVGLAKQKPRPSYVKSKISRYDKSPPQKVKRKEVVVGGSENLAI